MVFTGWTDEAVAFYEDLEDQNTRAFWLAHKAVYETQVLEPMQALLTELAPEFGEAKIFRPYRDTRFSKDKAPYKTAIAATLAGGGYVQFAASGLGAGMGFYQMAPDQLDRFRRAVDQDLTGVQLERIAAKLAKSGSAVSGHEMLKTAPRGYPQDHPRIELLRGKGLVVWRDFPAADWLGSGSAKAKVAAFFRAGQPLQDWLATNVGQSSQQRR